MQSTILAFAVLALTAISNANAQALYSIGSPSNYQQYMLELVNRARANGGAEAARLGLSGLQEGPPSINGQLWTIENSVQPLSWNSRLQTAAQGHAAKLNSADQFFLGGSPHTFGALHLRKGSLLLDIQAHPTTDRPRRPDIFPETRTSLKRSARAVGLRWRKADSCCSACA